MADQRPLHSPMPADAKAIGERVVAELKPILDAAFAEILALPGDVAERQNDALSMCANTGGFVALELAARIMSLKRCDPETAMAAAIGTIADNMTANFVFLVLGGQRV